MAEVGDTAKNSKERGKMGLLSPSHILWTQDHCVLNELCLLQTWRKIIHTELIKEADKQEDCCSLRFEKCMMRHSQLEVDSKYGLK